MKVIVKRTKVDLHELVIYSNLVLEHTVGLVLVKYNRDATVCN